MTAIWRFRWTLPAVLMLGCLAPALAAPLVGKNLYLPYTAYLTLPVPGDARPATRGYRVTTRHYYLNDFRPFVDVPDEQTEAGARSAVNVDYESYVTQLSAEFDVAPRIAIGVGASWHLLYGGFLDPVIEGFHRVLALPNARRHYFAQNQVVVQMPVHDGPSLTRHAPLAGAGSVDLWSHADAYRSGNTAFIATAALRFPVPDPSRLISAPHPDVGFGVTAHYQLGDPLQLYGQAGVVVPIQPSRWTHAGVVDARHMLNALVGLTYHPAQRLSLAAELRLATPPYHLDRLYGHPLFGTHQLGSLPQTSIVVGGAYQFGAGTLKLYVEEDFLTWEGADFLLAVSWTTQLFYQSPRLPKQLEESGERN